ncbi:hypothetical protein Ddc_18512 [Ditylenchus destructor]|nr:hypothetical protein Ddc_18512 [Ditylenchus destructor]
MSSLPNEIFADLTNFLPNDDVTDLMLLSKKFNALVTRRLQKIDEDRAIMNQSIDTFLPSPAPEYTNDGWISQLNLKRFEPIGSKAKNQVKQLFENNKEFEKCFHKLDGELELDIGTLDSLKEKMSLERFDDPTFLRILFTLVALPKFRQEYNISNEFAKYFHKWLYQFAIRLQFHLSFSYYSDVTRIWKFYNKNT